MVIHKQLYRHYPNGVTVNTTLCNRISNAGEDGNVTSRQAKVTCKFCLKKIRKTRESDPTKGARDE